LKAVWLALMDISPRDGRSAWPRLHAADRTSGSCRLGEV
jgi:hypothetical protein